MPSIEQICLPTDWRNHDLWPQVAAHTQQWLAARSLSARDAIVLLPFAALLAPARAALAAAGGWQPRVETPLTLAAALGPPVPLEPGLCSGEPVLDRLSARALLQRQNWARDWARRDPAGFDRIVGAVVDAAQTLRSGAHERAPSLREAFWAQARGSLAAPTGPAAVEALLLQAALEWAEAAAAPATDRLFALQPSAWVVLRVGGPDPVAESLLAASAAPALVLAADPPVDEPFADACRLGVVQRVLCEDFEAEAQAAAAGVIDALNAGRAPVALVALDRALVRRVRALLDRQHVPLIDETGWVLATTRAAASVLALLKAAHPAAPQDVLLEWLKDWPAAAPRALDSLEALWRERRRVPDRDAAEALWQQARAHLLPLTEAPAQPLASWLRRLHEVLAADDGLARLQADAAGAQVLAALRLHEAGGAAWQQAAAQSALSLTGFSAWVQATLEQLPFLPPPDPEALVVLTPLSRAFGRPFGHLVVPGADHRHLGSGGTPPALIGDAWAAALGLEHAAVRRERQQAALGHLLRAGPVTLLRRHRDDDEPLAESPLVDWLLLCRERAGLTPWPLTPWSPRLADVPLQPVSRPQPVAPAAALPALLSATQLEALRACPYRFYARAVLRLDEAEELDTGLAKREYGNWLHAVLHHFHSERVFGQDAAPQLQQAADHITLSLKLDDGEMLPWRASFETFAPAYLAWCAQREAQGWYWADGESDHRRAPPELHGLALRGRIDRLDHGPNGEQQLFDYKTGSLSALTAKVREPLEDTQLAFYAALLGGADDLAAAYVALDAPDAPREVAHAQVHLSAATLLQGLGHEWLRLRDGAVMQALGEGPVCETCEARGLCRRDHWDTPGDPDLQPDAALEAAVQRIEAGQAP